MKRILGLGNALVDILVKISDDSLLQQLELPKGSMQLTPLEKAQHIQQLLDPSQLSQVSGGSAANTIHGIASLENSTGFIGTVGNDNFGSFYQNDLEKLGVKCFFTKGQADTGRAYTFISEDGERTFATYLGAAIELSADMLTSEMFEGFDILHVEGYLAQNYALLEKAFRLARQQKMIISLDLASYNVVEEHHDFLVRILPEYVDIVFANEEEARAFTKKDPHEALNIFSCYCKIAIVKTGREGSLIKTGNSTFEVAAIPANVVDTTGAGDQYAAGFLYGYAHDKPLRICGKIGALLAGNVIENIGARIPLDRWENIKIQIKKFTY